MSIFVYIFRNVSKEAGHLTSCYTKKQVGITFTEAPWGRESGWNLRGARWDDCEWVRWCQDCFCVLSEEEKNQNESKNCLERDMTTDPWPGYRYTGRLRPHYPLVRPRKSLFYYQLELNHLILHLLVDSNEACAQRHPETRLC